MNETPNAAQKENWSGPSGLSWITHEEEMDRMLASATKVLLDHAGSVAGQRVLDIGCGTGAVSLAFADAGALVTASDISAPLLERAAVRAGGRFATLLADAQVADWTESYDMTVSRFGVMFFDDPQAAFANIARALPAGGKMLFAAWGPFDENLWWHMPEGIAARRMGVEVAASNPHAPGPMALADIAWSLARMRSPALVDVGCEAFDITLDHTGGALAAGELATRLGPAARVLKMHGASEDDRAHVARAITEELSAHATDGTVRVPARILLYSARKL